MHFLCETSKQSSWAIQNRNSREQKLFNHNFRFHMVEMSIPCCQQQRRRLTRRSTGRNIRPGLSAIRLSVVLFTAYFLSTCINWLHYKSAQISNLENNDDNQGTVQLPGTSISPQSSRKSVGTKNEDGNAEIDRENKRNIPYSSGLLKIIEGKSKFSETEDHLVRLSLSSNVDVEDLGMYLANKSATVYNPGTMIQSGAIHSSHSVLRI